MKMKPNNAKNAETSKRAKRNRETNQKQMKPMTDTRFRKEEEIHLKVIKKKKILKKRRQPNGNQTETK